MVPVLNTVVTCQCALKGPDGSFRSCPASGGNGGRRAWAAIWASCAVASRSSSSVRYGFAAATAAPTPPFAASASDRSRLASSRSSCQDGCEGSSGWMHLKSQGMLSTSRTAGLNDLLLCKAQSQGVLSHSHAHQPAVSLKACPGQKLSGWGVHRRLRFGLLNKPKTAVTALWPCNTPLRVAWSLQTSSVVQHPVRGHAIAR